MGRDHCGGLQTRAMPLHQSAFGVSLDVAGQQQASRPGGDLQDAGAVVAPQGRVGGRMQHLEARAVPVPGLAVLASLGAAWEKGPLGSPPRQGVRPGDRLWRTGEDASDGDVAHQPLQTAAMVIVPMALN